MKIEVAPWMQGYDVQMEELYTELTLEKIDNKALGQETQKPDDYKRLFQSNYTPAKKILGKAEPGKGKTRLSKKIAYD